MKNLLRSLALLLLVLPITASAGSQSLSGTDTTITLDTPPPGASRLHIRFTSTSSRAIWGVEYTGPNPHTGYQTFKSVVNVMNGSSVVLVRSTVHHQQVISCSGFDGTFDYGGTSGFTTDDTVNLGAGDYAIVLGLPTTLTVARDWSLVMDVQGNGGGFWQPDLPLVVDWFWV